MAFFKSVIWICLISAVNYLFHLKVIRGLAWSLICHNSLETDSLNLWNWMSRLTRGLSISNREILRLLKSELFLIFQHAIILSSTHVNLAFAMAWHERNFAYARVVLVVYGRCSFVASHGVHRLIVAAHVRVVDHLGLPRPFLNRVWSFPWLWLLFAQSVLLSFNFSLIKAHTSFWNFVICLGVLLPEL